MIEVHPCTPGQIQPPIRSPSSVTIGRDGQSTLHCANWRVARHHAVLHARSGTVWISDLGSWAGTWVNGRRIVADTPLMPQDHVAVGPLRFSVAWVDDPAALDAAAAMGAAAMDAAATAPAATAPAAMAPAAMGVAATAAAAISSDAAHLPSDANLSPLADDMTMDSTAGAARTRPGVRLDAGEGTRASSCFPVAPASEWDAAYAEMRALEPIRLQLHARLLAALDLRREDVSGMSDKHLRARARHLLEGMLQADPDVCPAALRERAILAVVDEAVGLGPLEPLLADDAVSEIMVNRHDEVYVEREGRLVRTAVTFANPASVLAVLERIVAPLGRRIDDASPMVDARLPDGSRVNGVIAPIALKGAALTIRKFARRRPAMDDLVRQGSLSDAMACFLGLCVQQKMNIIVSGGTGSGKTTLLNILSAMIGRRERVITIEDAAELQLPLEHVVALESRPANIEGQGAVAIRDLVRNALRMRPDRIVVGECRGGEAFDMLAAMNTGHEGSLTTLHANTARDALARLETMILMAGLALPLSAVREHISAGIDIIVQQTRLDDGRRVICDIAEVAGMDSGGIQLQSVFVRDKRSATFCGTGVIPTFVDDWRARGVVVPAEWFDLRSRGAV